MDSGDGEGGEGDDEDGEETEIRAYRRPAKRAAPHDAHGNGNGLSNGTGAPALYPDEGVSATAQQRMLQQAAADLTEAMGAIRHGGDTHYEAPLPWPAAAAFHHAGGAAAAAHLQVAPVSGTCASVLAPQPGAANLSPSLLGGLATPYHMCVSQWVSQPDSHTLIRAAP